MMTYSDTDQSSPHFLPGESPIDRHNRLRHTVPNTDHHWRVNTWSSGGYRVDHTSKGPGSRTSDAIGVSDDILGIDGLTRADAERIANALNEAYQAGITTGKWG